MTQVNIDRIMDDDERFRRLIVDFENSNKTPQFNENEKITKFQSFIRPQLQRDQPKVSKGTFY